jgi:hypothetical protein
MIPHLVGACTAYPRNGSSGASTLLPGLKVDQALHFSVSSYSKA